MEANNSEKKYDHRHTFRKNILEAIEMMIALFCVAIIIVASHGHSLLFFINFLVPQTTVVGCMALSLHVSNATICSSVLELTTNAWDAFFLYSEYDGESFVIFLIDKKPKSIINGWFDCRISPRSSDVHQNPEEPEGEDEDVEMERVRTANALNSTNFDEVKTYKVVISTRNTAFPRRRRKSPQGEVLGLLGHNGAGKSTSIKVITGDTKLTAGQVLLKGSSEGDPLGFLGYCPQEKGLWPNLTVREHLDVFAAVRGLRKADATVTITRLVEALRLQEEQKRPVKALSEGIKRKLCFALSILGNPSVVLLDEPSTGMDPAGQQQMWQAIRASFNNTERGALLTTHYMAEAEAVCDRVAIMVSGRLRCIGSIQHLKSKFGKDYLLEMKVKTLAHTEPLHSEILRLFPQAARQERYSSLMVYKLPVEDVRPLGQAFFKLERVKQSFDLEEYSLSQSTLEQVFLELSKEQELENFVDELQPSMKRKLLPQEEL
ncbi:ATP-binding cassette sub-family A member 8-like [Myotis myotis]|uniref:ATP-binding cassette sub-family A member 8-like n=1 Tax=Myotis myotis TaxID=51298 RepID=UPI00174E0678|nr:ATP-binding cassette sub-family A member 8-like [Myotis myotis]